MGLEIDQNEIQQHLSSITIGSPSPAYFERQQQGSINTCKINTLNNYMNLQKFGSNGPYFINKEVGKLCFARFKC